MKATCYLVMVIVHLARAQLDLKSIDLLGRLSSPDSSWNTTVGIYDGQKTTIEEHPYLVAVHVFGKFAEEATIISSSWVVLSAIIANDPRFNLSDITLVAGSSDGVSGKKYALKKLVVHPKYRNGFDYDYALGQIQGEFEWSNKIKPIVLATKQPEPNTPMVVVSWGNTHKNSVGASNRVMMQGTMNWMSKEDCVAALKNTGVTITSRMGCVYNKGKTTICNGDSSAPFVNKNLLYGFTIAGGGDRWCSSAAIPALVANVPTVVSWIKEVTGAKTEEDED